MKDDNDYSAVITTGLLLIAAVICFAMVIKLGHGMLKHPEAVKPKPVVLYQLDDQQPGMDN